MSYCDECNEELPLNSHEWHTFSGYGWYVRYHAACCPFEMDGWECSKAHPSHTMTPDEAEELRRFAAAGAARNAMGVTPMTDGDEVYFPAEGVIREATPEESARIVARMRAEEATETRIDNRS